MSYHVVFDASQEQSFPWLTLALPIALIVGAILIWRRSRRRRQPHSEIKTGVGLAYLSVFVLAVSCIGVLLFLMSLQSYGAAQEAISSGTTLVVEGPTANFTPQPPFDKGVESFTVDNVRFAYPESQIGFRQTSTHGGPINGDGISVRIHYIQDPLSGYNLILKLEIADQH